MTTKPSIKEFTSVADEAPDLGGGDSAQIAIVITPKVPDVAP